MMELGPQGCQRVSEIIRKQKRKALDARRSKCRIRIGSHLEQWCLLKDQLGFSLHSQLAKYLLDRYSSHGSVLKTGSDIPDVLPDSLPSEALQHLVVLSHHHSQECRFLPHVKPALRQQETLPNCLVWECLAGHTFSWSPPAPKTCSPPAGQAASRGREEEEAKEEEEKAVSSKPSPPPSPITRIRRSLRRAAAAHAISLALASNSPCPEDEEAEKSSREDGEGGADRRRTACMSPGNGAGLGKEAGLPSGSTTEEPAASEEFSGRTEPPGPGSTVAPLEEISESVSDPPEEEGGEDFAEDEGGLYTDDLRDEYYQPSLDSYAKTQTRDEEMLQIGPKRIRKAAKREILLCDYDGCGKIFSNRQYLNHHQKYQHVHQKTFTCSDPTCGKSFNFKKHLKEHEKLHSDKRDYICEFCARSFRTSSNLIIHRRIHTGEKPLQCEICGFTCRQKASLNWHMKKHDADSFYQFSCDLCGKKFEKKDNVTAHKSKSHPEVTAGPPLPVQEPPAPSSPLVMEQPTDPLQSQLCDPGKMMEPTAVEFTDIIRVILE